MINKDAIKLLILFIATVAVSFLKDAFVLLAIFSVAFVLSIQLKTLRFLLASLCFSLVYLLIFFVSSDADVGYGFATALRTAVLSSMGFIAFKFINLPKAFSFSKKLSFMLVSVLVNLRNALALKEELEMAFRSRAIEAVSWKEELRKIDVWFKVILTKLEVDSKESKDGIKSRWIDI